MSFWSLWHGTHGTIVIIDDIPAIDTIELSLWLSLPSRTELAAHVTFLIICLDGMRMRHIYHRTTFVMTHVILVGVTCGSLILHIIGIYGFHIS